MKKLYSFLILLAALSGFAQIPAGYYNSATGTGYTLKTQLYNIIKNHTDKTYAGLYVTYTTSDKDFYYENDGTMLDMYTEQPTGSECEFTYGVNQDDGTGGNTECDKYNREHLIPQSVFGAQTPMYSDAHFVVPSDKHVNAVRADFPFGRVGTATYTSNNGSKLGGNLNSGYSAGYTGTVFEPIDEFKGDIARMYFYFATRYQNLVAGWTYPMFNGTADQVFTSNAINILLTWANQDPVSQREIDRNNAIYARQNNRNPYIDHPEYAMQIWGSLLSTPSFDGANQIVVYPNPSNNHKINIISPIALESIELITVSGQSIQNIKHPSAISETYILDNLPSGFYFLKLGSGGAFATRKILIQ
ncbi:MAG: T9SS type A sorting domain-containing protein [Flavobacterium sp.]|nr:MAG: T9SS type A sorting domain-containing protein [Flavobacterium sp.]